MPTISRESPKEKQLREQRQREADEAIAPWKFRKVEPTPVPAIKYELYGVEVSSRDAQVLWLHLNQGQEHILHGEPAQQTDAQLAETYWMAATTPEHVTALLNELVEKKLIIVEQRSGKRFINTTTPRTCGLG